MARSCPGSATIAGMLALFELAVGTLLMTQAPAEAPAIPPPICYPARQKIEVDGRLDEWDRRGPIRIDRPEQRNLFEGSPISRDWQGAADASAVIYLAYDEEYLYIGGEVRDDLRLHDDQVWWNGDCLELFLDVDREGDRSETVWSDDDLQICLMPYHSGRSWGVSRQGLSSKSSDGGLHGIKVAGRPTQAAGYTFEVQIPFGNFPTFKPGQGVLGFNLALHDHDPLPDGTQRHSYLTINGASHCYSDTSRLLDLEFLGDPVLRNPEQQKWLGKVTPWLLSIFTALLLIGLVGWVAWPVFSWVDSHLTSWRRMGLLLIAFLLFVVFGAPFLVGRFLESRVAEEFEDRSRVVGKVVADLGDELQLHEGRGLEGPGNLLALLRGRPVAMTPLYDYTCFELRPRKADPNLRQSLEGVPVRHYGFDVPAGKQLSLALPEPMVLKRLFLFGSSRFKEEGRGRPGASSVREGALAISVRFVDGSRDPPVLFPAIDRDLSGGLDVPVSDRHGFAYEESGRQVEQYFLGLEGDRLVRAVTLTVRDQDIEFRLGGVTYARAGSADELEPLSLARSSLAGPPAALWNGFPRRVQVDVSCPPGRSSHVVPIGKALDSIFVFYNTTDLGVGDPGLKGVEVGRFTVGRAGAEPLSVPLRARVNIVNGSLDPANRPSDLESKLAYHWLTSDPNPQQIEMIEIPLPAADTRPVLTDLMLENLGPLSKISLFAVTGGTLAAPVPPRAGSSLEERGDSLALRPELINSVGSLDVAVFKAGQVAELDFADSDLRESLRGALYPLGTGEAAGKAPGTQRAILAGEPYLLRYFELGREEGERLLVAAAAKVRGLSFLKVTQRRVGIGALALIIPLLLFYILDGAMHIARLRLRLTTLLIATSLAPIVILFAVLYNVVASDRTRLRESQAATAMREVRGRLLEKYRQVQVTSRAVMDSEVVRGIRNGEALDRVRIESYLQGVVRADAASGLDLAVRIEVELLGGQRLGFYDSEGHKSASRFDLVENGIRYYWNELLFCSSLEGPAGQGMVRVAAVAAVPPDLSRDLGRATSSQVSLSSLRGFPVAGASPGDSGQRALDVEAIQKQGSPVIRERKGGAVVCTDLLRAPGGDPAALIELVLPPDVFLLDVVVTRLPLEKFFFWLCVLTLAAGVFMGAVATWRITTPVLELEGAAQRIARGDLDVEVETGGRGEVGRLARSFNTMTLKLKHRAAVQARLERAMASLTSSMEPTAAAGAALNALAEEPLAESCALYRVETERDRLQRLGKPKGDSHGLPLNISLGTAWEQFLAEPEARIFPPGGASAEPLEPVRLAGKLSLVLPLTLSGRTMGVAILRYGEKVGVDELKSALPILQHLGGQISVSLENSRLYGLAVADPLTGLYVESYFENRLTEEVDRAQHQGSKLSLVRIDLEDLERIERSLGRAQAREAVVRVARVIRTEAREMYLVARSNQSFLVLLPETGARLAEEFRDRLLKRVEALRSGTGDALRLSAQGGAATFPEDGRSTAFLLDAAAADVAGSRRRKVQEALAASDTEGDGGHAGELDVHPYVFHSEVMRDLLDQVAKVAPSQASVLILGETGTGKEVIADLLHRWSDRAHRPFLAINCSAVPESLLEAELFGFEKGAFTGAVHAKPGQLEEASGGTFLLDEVGDMPMSIQAKLLRVLQDQQIVRLGGRRPRVVDVRVLAATNRDPRSMIDAGTFRADLYYRLKVVSLTVPRLQERREDIPILVDHFVKEFNRENSRSLRGVSPAALDLLYRYDWPGNIRELKNVLDRAMLMTEGNLVLPSTLLFEPVREPPSGGNSGRPGGSSPTEPEQAGTVLGEELNERQRRLLTHLNPGQSIRSREYFELVGVSPRTGLRDLNDMIDKGLMVRFGHRRAATYRLRS
ncbi:MAG: sigma 54-interacting transcriptional regulator [Planctomycetota bacterium]